MPKVLNILLIEDNADDEELTLRTFQRLGWGAAVDVARDGQEALDRLHRGEGPLPDLVLLDLHLPKISGVDVLRAIRENEGSAGLPVVVLATKDEPDSVRRAYSLYTDICLHKPILRGEITEIAGRLGLL